jgi:NADH-quinone oxidoreductase B subunit
MMSGQGSTGNVIAALCSFFIPGLGQLLQGRLLMAILQFCLAGILDASINWMRKNSLWPMPMGLACCAIELMAASCARFDIARFGAEVMRFSPRQSDLLIVAGTVTYKMALSCKRIYDQMPDPKWCIAMGACASTGGMYRSYAVLQGIDQIPARGRLHLRLSPPPRSAARRA